MDEVFSTFTLGVVLPRLGPLTDKRERHQQAAAQTLLPLAVTAKFASRLYLYSAPSFHLRPVAVPDNDPLIWGKNLLTCLINALQQMQTSRLILLHAAQQNTRLRHLYPLIQHSTPAASPHSPPPPVGYCDPHTQAIWATPALWHKKHAPLLEPLAFGDRPLRLEDCMRLLRAILYDPGREHQRLEPVASDVAADQEVPNIMRESWQVTPIKALAGPRKADRYRL